MSAQWRYCSSEGIVTWLPSFDVCNCRVAPSSTSCSTVPFFLKFFFGGGGGWRGVMKSSCWGSFPPENNISYLQPGFTVTDSTSVRGLFTFRFLGKEDRKKSLPLLSEDEGKLFFILQKISQNLTSYSSFFPSERVRSSRMNNLELFYFQVEQFVVNLQSWLDK